MFSSLKYYGGLGRWVLFPPFFFLRKTCWLPICLGNHCHNSQRSPQLSSLGKPRELLPEPRAQVMTRREEQTTETEAGQVRGNAGRRMAGMHLEGWLWKDPGLLTWAANRLCSQRYDALSLWKAQPTRGGGSASAPTCWRWSWALRARIRAVNPAGLRPGPW